MKTISTITSIDKLVDYLDSQKVSNELRSEIIAGIQKNSMSLRLTHHILSLVNWRSPLQDPIRKQFLPLQSEYIESHPKAKQDSLEEKLFQPQDGLIHRYPNKVLFLVSNVCPAYCSFCTRSYAIGPNTDSLMKYRWTSSGKSFQTRVKELKEYLEINSNVTDILLSGGDIASVEPQLIDELLDCLSSIQSLQTIRLATRTLLFEPSLFFHDMPLFRIITKHAQNLRKNNRELSIQSHFNHSSEISLSSRAASLALKQAGVTIRNQTVLLDGVNATFEIQKNLIENLWVSGIQPYYVYQMDMVSNVEHFRTKLSTAIDISKQLTGIFAGFKLPRFIVDLPSGGGKRSVYEYEFYDEEKGIYDFRSPCLSDGKIYHYHDPLRYLNDSTKI